jgi:O-antigen/teichoic acid export membrane protein
MGHIAGIGRGTVYIMAAKAATFVLMAVQAVIVPRMLGPESMGFFSYWLSVFFILGGAFDFGGGSILNRYLPEYWYLRPAAVRPLLKNTVLAKLPIIALALSTGWFVFRGEASHFFVVGASAVIYSASMVIGAIFYGRKKLGVLSAQGFCRILVRLLLILCLYPLMGQWGILLAILGSTFFATALFAVPALDSLPPAGGALPKPFREYLSFGLWFYVALLFAMMTRWTAVIMAERWVGDMALVGFLGLALQISMFIMEFVGAVGMSVFPSLVEFRAASDNRFGRAIELNWRYTNMLALPIVGGTLVLVRPAIAVLIGGAFLPATGVIHGLMPYVLFLAWNSVHHQILFAFERYRVVLAIRVLQFSVFFGLAFILMPAYGIAGAPISLGAAGLVGFGYVWWASSRLERISGYVPAVLKPLLATAVMAALIHLIPIGGIAALAGAVVAGALVYGCVMWAVGGIGGEDLVRLKEVFRNQKP